MRWHKEIGRSIRDNAVYEGFRFVIFALIAAAWPAINGVLHGVWNEPWYWKLNGVLIAIAIVLFVVALVKFFSVRKPASAQIVADPEFVAEPKSKLKIECGPNIEGCVATAMWRDPAGAAMPVRFLRIAVFTDSPSITGCKGFLTRIESGGKKRWGGESAPLTFAPGEADDALLKTIYSKVPAFLDVLAVTSAGDIHVCTKGRQWLYLPGLHQIFSEVGDYVVTVVVTGDGISSETSFLRFNWTGNWQTSFLTLIENGQNMVSQGTAAPQPLQLPEIDYTRERRMQEVELTRLAENWFRPRLNDRVAAFRKAGQRKLGEFTARGWTASPHMYGAVEILAGEEIELRGNIILEGYAKALTATASAVTPVLQSEIQHDLNALITAESEQVRQSIQYVADACKPSMPKDAAALRASAIVKIAADFDLLCARVNRERSATPPPEWFLNRRLSRESDS